jgi:hypothetical protein
VTEDLVSYYVQVALLLFVLLSGAAGQTGNIRAIDFKNFTYPWDEPPGVPSTWEWKPVKQGEGIPLKNGIHRFPLPDDPSRHDGYLALVSITYGDLDGLSGEEAAIDLRYGTGGTANWHYLLVYTVVDNKPKLLSRLESGSRADGGLVGVSIRDRKLILEFQDSQRRVGDCCSRGLVRVTYRFENGRFQESSRREKDIIRVITYPFPQFGPGTVASRGGNIVYTDQRGHAYVLTSSGKDTEPELSLDKSCIVFLRKTGEELNEIWMVNTDGSEQRLLYRGPVPTRRTPHSLAARSPRISRDKRHVYFLVDTSATSGSLWRLDILAKKVTMLVPGALEFELIHSGRYRDHLIARRRALSLPDLDGNRFPEAPFFLFTRDGRRIAKIGEEEDDLDSLITQYSSRQNRAGARSTPARDYRR